MKYVKKNDRSCNIEFSKTISPGKIDKLFAIFVQFDIEFHETFTFNTESERDAALNNIYKFMIADQVLLEI